MTAPRFTMTIDGRTDDAHLRYEFTDSGEVKESGRALTESEIQRRFRAFVAVRSWEPA